MGSGMGSATERDEAARTFALWLDSGKRHSEWESLQAVILELVPAMLSVVRGVAAATEMDGLRRRLTHALRATAVALGQPLTLRVLLPLLSHASGLPYHMLLHRRQTTAEAPTFLHDFLFAAEPTGAHAGYVGRTAILPQLLAAILPKCGEHLVAPFLTSMAKPMGGGEIWMVTHAADVATALQFVGKLPDMHTPLLALLWDLVVNPAVSVRVAAAPLAKALVVCLPADKVARQLLPALVTLCSATETSLRVSAVGALAEVSRVWGSNRELLEKVHDQLDILLGQGEHEVQLEVVRVLGSNLNVRANVAQLEYLLQKLLYLLATMHARTACGRTMQQLREMLGAACDAVAIVETCDLNAQSLQLHLLAAIDALQREADLLEPTQRELLTTMKEERSASTPALTLPQRAQRPEGFTSHSLARPR